jgi:excisionase family DNA binding protein
MSATATTESKPLLMRGREVCAALAISRWTLQRYVQAGLVRTVKPLGQIRFLAADVLRLAEPQVQETLAMMRPGEAARMLGLSAQSIERMSRSGKLRSVRTPGGHLRVATADVESVLSQQGLRHGNAGSVAE